MSASPGPPEIFDSRRRAAKLARGEKAFAAADFLHMRAAENAVNSLEVILRDFPDAVDLSARPGPFARLLADSVAAARVGAVRVAGDETSRAALTQAELEVRGGAQARVSPFADGFDGAALLQRAGFALPVADVDRLTVRYSDLYALIRDLRAMGETNALAGPIRPISRGMLARAAEVYAERFAEPDGRIPATFEIIHLAGWAPHESQQKPLPRGSAKVRLADALGVREWTGEEG